MFIEAVVRPDHSYWSRGSEKCKGQVLRRTTFILRALALGKVITASPDWEAVVLRQREGGTSASLKGRGIWRFKILRLSTQMAPSSISSVHSFSIRTTTLTEETY